MGMRKRVAKLSVYVGISAACLLLVFRGVATNARAGEGGTAAPARERSGAASQQQSPAATTAKDPGARTDAAGAGAPLLSLTADELAYFQDGLSRFNEVDSVGGTEPGTSGRGLGPTFNSNSCASCHARPATGGSSPSVNPQFAVGIEYGASNSMPAFIAENGPVREVRFPYLMNANGTVSQTPDGGVHDLFTITGRRDAPNFTMAQPDFAQIPPNNMIFRIPTPVFGAGLIENIAEATIYANMFEMGVTNELFPDERSGAPATCMTNPTPEDSTNFPASGSAIPSDVVAFSNFMRFLAPPTPSVKGIPGNPSLRSIADGQALFGYVHCDLCHTPTMQTSTSSFTKGLNNQTAALFSDLLVHHMGSGLADNISQGAAGPDEFRTAPLWGLGQRLFFLHDGRATPANGGLLTAIEAHASTGSEANGVINIFNQLTDQQKQDLLNFLRSL